MTSNLDSEDAVDKEGRQALQSNYNDDGSSRADGFLKRRKALSTTGDDGHDGLATCTSMVSELEGIKAELRMLYLERSQANVQGREHNQEEYQDAKVHEALGKCGLSLSLARAEAIENYNYATNLREELKKLQDWFGSTTQAPAAKCPPCPEAKVRARVFNLSCQQHT